jgi:hypothetical protein
LESFVTGTDPLAGLDVDEVRAVSSASALVVVALQNAYGNTSLSKEELAEFVFHGNDLISAYLEVHMGLERDEAVKVSTNLLSDLIESGDLK